MVRWIGDLKPFKWTLALKIALLPIRLVLPDSGRTVTKYGPFPVPFTVTGWWILSEYFITISPKLSFGGTMCWVRTTNPTNREVSSWQDTSMDLFLEELKVAQSAFVWNSWKALPGDCKKLH